MNRCLSEPALLELYSGDGTWAERTHLRLCADCAERYDAVIDDLKAISDILIQAPPRAPVRSYGPIMALRWVPAAAAAMVLVVALVVMQRHLAMPVHGGARTSNESALAADVSAALFEGDDMSRSEQQMSDMPYLEVALEAGLPCTQERFYDGRCDDQVAALVFEGE